MKKTAFYLTLVLTLFAFVVASNAQDRARASKKRVSFKVASFIPKEPTVQQGKFFNVKLTGDNLDRISHAKVYFTVAKKGKPRPKVIVMKRKITAKPEKYYPPKGNFKGARVIRLIADKASADPNKNKWISRTYKLMLFEKGVKRPYFLKDIHIKVIKPLNLRF